jgi:hypothetical protein
MFKMGELGYFIAVQIITIIIFILFIVCCNFYVQWRNGNRDYLLYTLIVGGFIILSDAYCIHCWSQGHQ